MADQKSGQLLAFNFASRAFAYLRLVQGLSRSLSSFSSFMREYLDKAIKADKCAQYVDDILDSYKHSRRAEKQFERGFPMHPHSRSPAYNGQMPVRCQGSRIPWTDDFPSRRGTPESQDRKICTNSQIPTNQEGTPKIQGLYITIEITFPDCLRKSPLFTNS